MLQLLRSSFCLWVWDIRTLWSSKMILLKKGFEYKWMRCLKKHYCTWALLLSLSRLVIGHHIWRSGCSHGSPLTAETRRNLWWARLLSGRSASPCWTLKAYMTPCLSLCAVCTIFPVQFSRKLSHYWFSWNNCGYATIYLEQFITEHCHKVCCGHDHRIIN